MRASIAAARPRNCRGGGCRRVEPGRRSSGHGRAVLGSVRETPRRSLAGLREPDNSVAPAKPGHVFLARTFFFTYNVFSIRGMRYAAFGQDYGGYKLPSGFPGWLFARHGISMGWQSG